MNKSLSKEEYNYLNTLKQFIDLDIGEGSYISIIVLNFLYSKEQSLKMIDMDLIRTFPNLPGFQPESSNYVQTRNTLSAFVIMRPDIGYL